MKAINHILGFLERILQTIAVLLCVIFVIISVIILGIPYWYLTGKYTWEEKWYDNLTEYLLDFSLPTIKLPSLCKHEFYQDCQITWVRCKKCGEKHHVYGVVDIYSDTFLNKKLGGKTK